MVIKAGIEAYLQYDKPSPDLKTRAQKMAGLLPMFFTAYIFKLGSGALLAVIFSYWTIPAFLAAMWLLRSFFPVFVSNLTLALHPIAMIRLRPVLKVRVSGKLTEFKFTEKERMKQLLFGNIGWFIVTIIGLIIAMILASTNPNMTLPTLTFSHETIISMKTYKLSEKALGSEDGPTQAFKILFSVFLTCGLASLGLIYR